MSVFGKSSNFSLFGQNLSTGSEATQPSNQNLFAVGSQPSIFGQNTASNFALSSGNAQGFGTVPHFGNVGGVTESNSKSVGGYESLTAMNQSHSFGVLTTTAAPQSSFIFPIVKTEAASTENKSFAAPFSGFSATAKSADVKKETGEGGMFKAPTFSASFALRDSSFNVKSRQPDILSSANDHFEASAFKQGLNSAESDSNKSKQLGGKGSPVKSFLTASSGFGSGSLFSNREQLGNSTISSSNSESEKKLLFPQVASSTATTSQRDSNAIIKERRVSSAQMSPEELKQCTMIKMPFMPPELNNQNFLFKHFKSFGRIRQIKCSPRMGVATVEFDNHESAKMAKEKGTVFRPGSRPVKILWVKQTVVGKPSVMKSGSLFTTGYANIAKRSSAEEEIAAHIVNSNGESNEKSNMAMRSRRFVQPLPPSPRTTSGVISSRFKLPVTPSDMAKRFAKVKRRSADETAATAIKENISREIGKAHEKDASVSISSSIAYELRALIGKQAITAQEKYFLLEERDKIIRKGRSKKSEVGIGNCPDMCPEKERYQREVRQQISLFEASDGVMDPLKAVKDYSRSSADQEEPLPHDMRPANVLRMTMDYLLHNIIKSAPPVDSELGDWFDFLWNRTRAIRKDLTQQQLCSLDAVELFEQITRFHIFVAHWMSSLDVVVFDQKINTENLSKCLQSLHQLYEDLGKHGVQCPNEPEFRSYEVLLNLNDSNVLRRALSWSQWVREAASVRCALRLCSAVQNSSYIAFFRLIRNEASYLQACFSHRYFQQIRKQALLIMVKGYGNNQQFPLSELCDWLGFESEADCCDFVSCYGLMASLHDGSYVLLNRTNFIEPSGADSPVTRRSISLIEQKRRMALSHLIAGGICNPAEAYNPVCSFDSNGYYNQDPVIRPYLNATVALESPEKRDSHLSEKAEISKDEEPLEHSPKSRLQQELEDKLLREGASSARKLLEETLNEETITAVLDTVVVTISNNLAENVVHSMIRSIVEEFYSEERKKTEVGLKTLLTICQEVCEDDSEEICLNEFRNAKFDRISELSAKEIDNTVEQNVEMWIRAICWDVFCMEVIEKQRRLQIIANNLKTIRLRQFFNHWKTVAMKSSRRKRLLSEFPVSPYCNSIESCAKNLGVKRRRVSDPYSLQSNVAFLVLMSAFHGSPT